MLGLNYDSGSDSDSEPEINNTTTTSSVSSSSSSSSSSSKTSAAAPVSFDFNNLPTPSFGQLPKPKSDKSQKKKKKKDKKKNKKKDKPETEVKDISASIITSLSSTPAGDNNTESVVIKPPPGPEEIDEYEVEDDDDAFSLLPSALPAPKLDNVPTFRSSFSISAAPDIKHNPLKNKKMSLLASVSALKRQQPTTTSTSRSSTTPSPASSLPPPFTTTNSDPTPAIQEPVATTVILPDDIEAGPSLVPDLGAAQGPRRGPAWLTAQRNKPKARDQIPSELMTRTERSQNKSFQNMVFKNVNAADLTYKSEKDELLAQFEDEHGPATEAKVNASFWNAQAGKFTTSATGSKVQKRKHQINTLAAQAAAMEVHIAKKRAMGYKHKAESKAKYGW